MGNEGERYVLNRGGHFSGLSEFWQWCIGGWCCGDFPRLAYIKQKKVDKSLEHCEQAVGLKISASINGKLALLQSNLICLAWQYATEDAFLSMIFLFRGEGKKGMVFHCHLSDNTRISMFFPCEIISLMLSQSTDRQRFILSCHRP